MTQFPSSNSELVDPMDPAVVAAMDLVSDALNKAEVPLLKGLLAIKLLFEVMSKKYGITMEQIKMPKDMN